MDLGLSALSPTVGLSGLPDPLGEATAALEARRRQQVTDAGYDPDQGLYDRYSAMLGSVLGPTINERAVAAREAMRRGDMATANALNQSLALDFGQFLGSIKPIRAYHGSPHDFDKFDMSKIGAGEGAQAYGHGLYFAENEGVARGYRDKLTDMRVDAANRALGRHGGDVDAAIDAARKEIDRLRSIPNAGNDPGRLDRRIGLKEEIIAELNALKRTGQMSSGRMYEVNIHADPERFLDWDALADDQPKGVADALSKTSWWPWTRDRIEARGAAHGSNPIGQHIIRDLADDYFPDEISALLNEAGIPGIKYLDAGSRAAGDGSRNYVVFDDKLIEILRKYGIMAPMAGMAGAGVGSLYMDGEREGM